MHGLGLRNWCLEIPVLSDVCTTSLALRVFLGFGKRMLESCEEELVVFSVKLSAFKNFFASHLNVENRSASLVRYQTQLQIKAEKLIASSEVCAGDCETLTEAEELDSVIAREEGCRWCSLGAVVSFKLDCH